MPLKLSQFASKYAYWLALIAVVGPLVAPLALLNYFYCYDWFAHLWPTGFIANYFRFHDEIPFAVNAQKIVAYPVPVFYGYLLYPMAGLVGSLLTPEVGLRLACATVLCVQFLLVAKAVERISGSKVWALATATIVSTAIYPLTNLYHRGAVAEFFTSTWVSCVVCCWAVLVQARDRATLAKYGVVGAVVLANLTGSHPITALFSALILAPHCLVGLCGLRTMPVKLRRGFLVMLALVLLYVLLANGAFLYALAKYSPHLGAAKAGGLTLAYDRSDFWWGRFFPFPLDKGSLILGTHRDTPYLELQVNMPLLFACLGVFLLSGLARLRGNVATRGLGPWLIFSAAFFILLSWFSLSLAPWAALPARLQVIQFPYRLISYCNGMLLAVLLSMMSLKKDWFSRVGERTPALMLTICVTLALSAMLVKLSHIGVVKANKAAVGAPSDPNFQEIYSNYAAFTTYTNSTFKALSPELAKGASPAFFVAGALGPQFGLLSDVSVNLPRTSWVETNLAAFEWNKLVVDGVAVPLELLKSVEGRYAMQLGAGRHLLHAQLTPDPIWMQLRTVSFFVIFMGLLAGLAVFLVSFSSPIRRS